MGLSVHSGSVESKQNFHQWHNAFIKRSVARGQQIACMHESHRPHLATLGTTLTPGQLPFGICVTVQYRWRGPTILTGPDHTQKFIIM